MLNKINWKTVAFAVAGFLWRFTCRSLGILWAFVIGFFEGMLGFNPPKRNPRENLFYQDTHVEKAPFGGPYKDNPYVSTHDYTDRLWDDDAVI